MSLCSQTAGWIFQPAGCGNTWCAKNACLYRQDGQRWTLMQCDIPWLRLTDGHAWINIIHETRSYERKEKPNLNFAPAELDPHLTIEQVVQRYGVKPRVANNWLVSVNGSQTHGVKAWEVYQKRYILDDVCIEFGITRELARARVYNYCKRHDIKMPKQDMTPRMVEMARQGASISFIAQMLCRAGHFVRSTLEKEQEKTGEIFTCLVK
jgi:hypothetical protein